MQNPYEAPGTDVGRAADEGGGAGPSAAPQAKLAWYEQLWIALPIGLVAVGGAIGGACGGAAWGVNQKIFRATKHPVLRYVLTGLVSVAAVIAYFALALAFVALTKGATPPANVRRVGVVDHAGDLIVGRIGGSPGGLPSLPLGSSRAGRILGITPRGEEFRVEFRPGPPGATPPHAHEDVSMAPATRAGPRSAVSLRAN